MNAMSLIWLLVFAVVMYALWTKGDVTLNGKAGFFSFFFQAKDRRAKKSCQQRRRCKTKSGPGPLAKRSTLDGAH